METFDYQKDQKASKKNERLSLVISLATGEQERQKRDRNRMVGKKEEATLVTLCHLPFNTAPRRHG
jgi:hypothetical protein